MPERGRVKVVSHLVQPGCRRECSKNKLALQLTQYFIMPMQPILHNHSLGPGPENHDVNAGFNSQSSCCEHAGA